MRSASSIRSCCSTSSAPTTRADYIAGFPDHPHRGFETVTYMLAGRMRHGDNQGQCGLLDAGSVQWMTAGRGIVHSEMPEQEDGLMWGFQLWVNLPAKDKMTAPRYQEFDPAAVPVVELAGGAGAGHRRPRRANVRDRSSAIATEPTLLDVALPAGGTFALDVPRGQNVFLYPFEGEALIGEPAIAVPRGTLAVLGEGERRAFLPAGRRRRGCCSPRPAAQRAGGPLRAVRHEHAGANSPGDRRLSGGPVLARGVKGCCRWRAWRHRARPR